MYFCFEKPLALYLNTIRRIYVVNSVCFIFAIVLTGTSIYCYKNSGIVKDFPELNLYYGKENMTPEMYNGSPFMYKNDFPDNGKKNIFVLGDSFGRDWVNILKASGVDSVMNISYAMYVDGDTRRRLQQADYVFVATNLPFFSSYNYDEIYDELFNRQFWRVGLKSFGSIFIGNIYSRRFSSDYHNITVTENSYSADINGYERKIFRYNFIDLMNPIKDGNGQIRIFTEDGKLITQDGIHLTEAGARMYADKIDVWQYLK